MGSAANTSTTFTSKDGTVIAYITVGKGPAVIVIPGALETAHEFNAFATALSKQHFTVQTIERRGRGLSGPQGNDYTINTECDDILALQEQTGANFLVGHSYGGLIALEAARLSQVFTKIAVYEPGVSINGSIATKWVPNYQAQLAQKQYLDAFTDFSIAMGPERAQKTPRWLMKCLLHLILGPTHLRQMLSMLPENLREHQEVARLDNSYRNYKSIRSSVLLMYGGKSIKRGQRLIWVDMTMKKLAEILPQSETKEFSKLDHFGIPKKGSQEVAKAVGTFLLG